MTHDEMIAKAYREWRELVEVTPSLDKPMEIAFVAGFRAAIRVIAPAVERETVVNIVAWLRNRKEMTERYIDYIETAQVADCIEAGEWK